jgi:hypothetical protein
MNRSTRIAAAAALVAGAAVVALPAHAQDSFAVQTATSTGYPCPSFCGGPGGRFDFDGDGGIGFTSSASSLSNIDGNARAEAQLTGPTSLPVLRAEAFSNANSSAGASAAGMQRFWLGDGSLDSYTLTAALTGNATGNVEANVILFRDNDPDSPAPFHPDYGTFRFEVLAGNDDLEILALATLTLPATGAAESASAELQAEGLSFGDLVYVWADLNAFGIRGSYGDAFNTLNLEFSNAAGLSQTRPPIPEPGTWGMLALGLGGLVWRGRRSSPAT